jgi:hypothetical protein
MISAARFALNCQDSEAVLFLIILKEINCKIQDQKATDQKLVIQKLPAEHQDLVNVFSQTNSDKLSLYCIINYKIVLEQENLLRFSLLYYMSLAELKTVKEYLFDNLNKGFIVLSQALYTSSVLFVKKSNRGLQFCIDYQKLNTIT